MSLTVSNLSAGYSGSQVLDGVSLELHPGEVVALLGRNGMGKSTLARTLAGSHPADSGQILLDDAPLERVSAGRRYRMGLRTVRQERPVVGSLSVRENLRLAKVRPDSAAEFFPFIAGRVDQDAGTLSGGEQKLLAIARVASSPGKYWVLDEPTEGLQPLNVDRCGEIVRAAAGSGCGVLLIEQHVALALAAADRWLVLEKGAIVEEGTVDEGALTRITARLTV